MLLRTNQQCGTQVGLRVVSALSMSSETVVALNLWQRVLIQESAPADYVDSTTAAARAFAAKRERLERIQSNCNRTFKLRALTHWLCTSAGEWNSSSLSHLVMQRSHRSFQIKKADSDTKIRKNRAFPCNGRPVASLNLTSPDPVINPILSCSSSLNFNHQIFFANAQIWARAPELHSMSWKAGFRMYSWSSSVALYK
jgi:hypothetical protein